jgi:hypothetical protein
VGRVCLYFRSEPERDRWLWGDRFLRPLIRRVIRGTPRISGVEKVFVNLRLGLDRLGVPYEVNLPFDRLRNDDLVGVLGRSRHCLNGYRQPNPIVAGFLVTHPSEWPSLCDEYPVVNYVQHSEWTCEIYRSYYGARCTQWPVGIDTAFWNTTDKASKTIDFLVYDKILWDRPQMSKSLTAAILSELTGRGLTYEVIQYGSYTEIEYRAALQRCRAMVFLCEHESQGFACLECLSSDVPVLAWDQGRWLDPNRFRWGMPEVPATSVPFFDDRCGVRFASPAAFVPKLDLFLDRQATGAFRPREYVLENLTVEKCSQAFIDLLEASRQMPAKNSTGSATENRMAINGVALAE